MGPHNILVALTQIAHGRDHIRTHEMAQALSRSPQTVRKNLCLHGHAWGIRPKRIQRRGPLLWPVRDIMELLQHGRL